MNLTHLISEIKEIISHLFWPYEEHIFFFFFDFRRRQARCDYARQIGRTNQFQIYRFQIRPYRNSDRLVSIAWASR